MLQVSSGKFFTTTDHHITLHRAALYTNYRVFKTDCINTVVGSLLPSGFLGDLSVLTCEVTERLEKLGKQPQPGELISVGGDTLINDFSALVSFVLNVICTPDQDLTRRLIATKRTALGTFNLPNKYIQRTFDAEVLFNANDIKQLDDFAANLIGKNRKTYQGVMRAIRRYVIGMHRISDDLDLAYALLVASIESLAQEFDGFSAEWSDYDEGKRALIDEALFEAPPQISEKVRATLLKSEHVALSRRFRHFTLAHLATSFFREEAVTASNPIGRADLDIALKNAYRLRSQYVHELRALPKQLTLGHITMGDMMIVDGQPLLTFHGLARVARHVIMQFVSRADHVPEESFDYRGDLPNIVSMPWAEQYWIWNADGYTVESAKNYLAGFLSQISNCMRKFPGAVITDFNPVLRKIETLMPCLKKPIQRLPMLALYHLFICYLSVEQRSAAESFVVRFQDDYLSPSIESLLVHVLTCATPAWTVCELDKLHADYMKQRYHKQGINVGILFEAVFSLWIAERHRAESNEVRARELISFAVENFPSEPGLRAFESSLDDNDLPTIEWQKILFA